MEERKEIQAGSGEPAKAEQTPEQTPAASNLKSELPHVESPSISPATEPANEPTAAEPAAQDAANVMPVARFFKFDMRHKRHALLAASLAVAAALGAGVGALASGGFAAPKPTEIAHVDDSKAMQQSIARLSRDVASLKASVEAANKNAQGQVAKLSERLSEQLNRAASEITGSISAPQSVTPAPQTVTPLPQPRPAQRVAAIESQPPPYPQVLQDWIIRDVYDGYVFVQGNGRLYRVSIGASLPGLGPVEQVKRQDGRWVVQTPKGIIVSLRDRRYFE